MGPLVVGRDRSKRSLETLRLAPGQTQLGGANARALRRWHLPAGAPRASFASRDEQIRGHGEEEAPPLLRRAAAAACESSDGREAAGG